MILYLLQYNKTEGASEQLAVKRSMLSTGHSNIGDDPDCLGSDSSEEDEVYNFILFLLQPFYITVDF